MCKFAINELSLVYEYKYTTQCLEIFKFRFFHQSLEEKIWGKNLTLTEKITKKSDSDTKIKNGTTAIENQRKIKPS